ncbi:MAG: hypothetical protein GY801_43985 [bacterium]|nr:hypothetical protein [bacterium]
MKIVVLSGSPKEEQSITLQYVKYLQKHFPEHEFTIFYISRQMKAQRRDSGVFQHLLDAIAAADGVLWASPVYFLCVPGQFKQFIELLFERKAEAVFQGKYAAVLMTSIHFFDNFAADYLHAVCDDLKMHYSGEFLAEMNDLKIFELRQQLLRFFEYFLRAMQEKLPTSTQYHTLRETELDYRMPVSETVSKGRNKKIVVLTDVKKENCNLSRMIDTFVGAMPYAVTVFDLQQIGKRGGCLECLERGCANDCRYVEPFRKFYEKYLFAADAVVFAGVVKDRHLSALWKLFWDRSFLYGHAPTLAGKPVGYLISGPLQQLPNLRESLKAYAQLISQGTMVDMVSDEYESSEQVIHALQGFADKLSWALEAEAKTPVNFYGQAGRLIFQNFVHLAHGIFVPDQQYHNIRSFYEFSQPVQKQRLPHLFWKVLHHLPFTKHFKKGSVRESVLKNLQRLVEEL